MTDVIGAFYGVDRKKVSWHATKIVPIFIFGLNQLILSWLTLSGTEQGIFTNIAREVFIATLNQKLSGTWQTFVLPQYSNIWTKL